METSDVEPILNINSNDENDQQQQQQQTNHDRFQIVRILFFLIGLSQLLPMNFLITADDLWKHKFRNVTSKDPNNDKTELQIYFESYLIIACNGPFLIVYVISMTDYFNRISLNFKIISSFMCTIVTFIIITAYVPINTDGYQLEFLAILLILVFIVNAASIFIQTIFAGLASLFPLKYMQSMVAGQAMSGLFAACTKIFSLLGHRTLVTNVFIFFLLANLVLIVTFSLYFYVFYKVPFYRTYAFPAEQQENHSSMTMAIFWQIFRQIWPFCLSLMFVFWITMSIYPGLFVKITPVAHETVVPEKFLIPITCFLIFNLGDFLGRSLGRYILLKKQHGYYILIISLCRILFIPIFLYCNAQPRLHISVIFSSEILFLLFNLIFAFTNGYLVLNIFINAPQLIPEQYRHFSAYFLIAFLGIGLTLGSLSSPLVIDLL